MVIFQSRQLSWDNHNFDFNSNSVEKSIRTSGGTSRRQQGNLSRVSKSRDDDGISDQRRIGSDEGIARWGTCGDKHVSLFGVAVLLPTMLAIILE